MGNSTCRCGLVVVLVLAAPPLEPAASGSLDPQAARAVELFLARPRVPHPYSAERRLEASGVGQHGWLEAHTGYSPISGLSYEVSAEGGSGYIRSRVLRSLLSEEQQLIARQAESTVALTTDNYEFKPEGITDEGLIAVELRPLRKDRALVAGRMFVTGDGALQRIEGRLAKTPSFWVTRVDVVRRYRPIRGVVMPVSLESTARLRLLGSSQLRMTYRYSMLDEQPIEDQEPMTDDR
jgi:hypothetical protein